MTQPTFTLEAFEYHALRGDHDEALALLDAGLTMLETLHGRFADGSARALTARPPLDGDLHLVTRFASAIAALLGDPALAIPPERRERLLYLQRWIGAVFAASPLGNSDHVLRATDPGTLSHADLLRYCLAWTPDSAMPIDLEGVWKIDPALALSLVISVLAARVFGSESAHARREAWLPWLAEKLDQTRDFEGLPIGLLHHVYMNCSYADRADKHEVKRAITALIRRVLARNGLHDTDRKLEMPDERPVMLVLLEQWLPGHSIYRTSSAAMEGARSSFRTIGVGFAQWVAPECRGSFDEFVELPNGALLDQLRFLRKLSAERGAQVLHLPSVGMFPQTMFAASLRIAPVQTMATGHPATTHSPAMDYLLVEGHYLGDAALWSETVLALPEADAIPYRPARETPTVVRTREDAPAKVRIAVCASIMKINPGFLAACAAIRDRAQTPVEFHFLPALAEGVIYMQLRKFVESYLGADGAVYPHLPYPDYMALLSGCDMFANSFPFGNTNGIVDTVLAGLPGVCKTGPEVHEHIDGGLLGRLGFPEWTVAQTTEDYVAAAVRLADDAPLRAEIRARCCGADKVQALFEGRPEIFGQRLLAQLRARATG